MTTTAPDPPRYSTVDVDVFRSKDGAPGRFLGTVRGILVAKEIVRVLPENRERAAKLLDAADPGLAAKVEQDEWLLREVEFDRISVVESGRATVVGEPGFWVERIRKGEDGRVDFAVFVREGLSRWEDGTARPDLRVEVWPVETRFGKPSPAEVSWPSTSDKRPILALGLSRALASAYVEAARQNEEAGL